ncbi:hypothetical protein OSB04_021047 [Centaurea solstitialis]|uniref:Uncharacterized protein n=1 Tax=Centaurea solstitialis TaxID=347529 RepID=A0AA38STG8_9ASTR|nr:hypothetical protein OSB04_021047 [Centaurea solstitialis]
MYVTVEVIEEPAYYHGGLGILLVVYDVTNESPFNSNCFNLSSTNIGGKNEGSNVCDIPIDWPLLTTEDIRMGVMKRSESCDRLDGVDDEPMSENDVKVAIPGLASMQLSNDNDIKVQQAGVTLRAWYRLD